jgi:hypothetical protein
MSCQPVCCDGLIRLLDFARYEYEWIALGSSLNGCWSCGCRNQPSVHSFQLSRRGHSFTRPATRTSTHTPPGKLAHTTMHRRRSAMTLASVAAAAVAIMAVAAVAAATAAAAAPLVRFKAEVRPEHSSTPFVWKE